MHDAYAFGATGLALAGDGYVAITRDAGATWQVVTPAGHSGTAFTAVAFTSSGRGLLASGGLLLVTGDWGTTWNMPVYADPTRAQRSTTWPCLARRPSLSVTRG